MWKTVSRRRMRKWREKKKEWCPLPIHRHAMDCWFCVKHITCEWWAGILWFLFGNMVQNWTILYASLFVCLREWCCRSCHISFDILWKYLRQLNWPVVMLLIMDKIYISTSKKEIEFRFSLFSCSISLFFSVADAIYAAFDGVGACDTKHILKSVQKHFSAFFVSRLFKHTPPDSQIFIQLPCIVRHHYRPFNSLYCSKFT